MITTACCNYVQNVIAIGLKPSVLIPDRKESSFNAHRAFFEVDSFRSISTTTSLEKYYYLIVFQTTKILLTY